MIPAARLQAAIEVLDRIAASRQPADQALKAWGAANRYAGSKDRKAVADRVYLCLRERGGHMADDGGGRRAVLASLALDDDFDAAAIAALFSGDRHAPSPLTPEEHAWLARLSDEVVLPPLLQRELERSFGQDARAEADALLRTRAPLDIRINSLRANAETVFAALDEAGIGCEPAIYAATGVRITSIADILALDLFKAGGFEVQDEGSQIATWLLCAGPVKTVVDYCAGGGGKTLALGQAMEGQGRLIACDLNPRRLDAIRPRLARAGVEAQLRRVGPTGAPLTDLIGLADRVLVDAPCSGSGTWRRRPEEAWRLTEAELKRLNGVQMQVLDKASALVRPGGRLAYVTCSVLARENGDIAAAFAANHADFRPLPIAKAAHTPLLTDAARTRLAELSAGGHTVQLSPRRTGTDGFFIALFERIS